MNCPGHAHLFKQHRHSYRELPVRYSEPGLLHRNEPQRHAARPAARPALHPGRRPHLLHGGAGRGRGARLPGVRLRLVPAVRLPDEGRAVDAAGEPARQRRVLGQDGGDARSARSRRPGFEYRDQRGRRRVLRAEDRPPHDRLAGPLVAARDGAARLQPARALRPHLHRGRQRRAPARDDPSRAAGILRALHRDPARGHGAASCRSGWRRSRRRCCPVADRHNDYGEDVVAALREAGLRAELDDRTESVGRKIRDTELAKVPYMLVVGDREAESGRCPSAIAARATSARWPSATQSGG